jgi:hypothetical protein
LYRWLDLFEDEPGRTSLVSRLEAAHVDDSEMVRQLERLQAGELDARWRQAYRQRAIALEESATALPVSDKFSRGAALFLQSSALANLSTVETPLEHLETTVRLMREAHDTCPALGAERRLPSYLVLVALHRAAQGNATVEAAVRRLRVLGAGAVLYQLLEGGDEGALAAIRSQPEAATAAALCRAQLADGAEASSLDWTLARLTRDEALLTASKAAFGDEQEVAVRVGALMGPNLEATKVATAMMAAGRSWVGQD